MWVFINNKRLAKRNYQDKYYNSEDIKHVSLLNPIPNYPTFYGRDTSTSRRQEVIMPLNDGKPTKCHKPHLQHNNTYLSQYQVSIGQIKT